MDFSGFLSGLVAEFIAATVAGVLVLYAAYRFVEPRLGLNEARQRRKETEAQRDETRSAVLTALHRELEAAAGHLQMMLKGLQEGGVPYPGFDVKPKLDNAIDRVEEELGREVTHTAAQRVYEPADPPGYMP